jgi:hypothetical protein
MTVQNFLEALELGAYAFPGGYPKYFVTGDCEPLSFNAAVENTGLILEALEAGESNDQWYITAVDINYEDTQLYCSHTGERIECAYGDDSDYEMHGTGSGSYKDEIESVRHMRFESDPYADDTEF